MMQKPCNHCKYAKKIHTYYEEKYICLHPTVKENSVRTDLIKGTYYVQTKCVEARDNNELCGRDGRLWKPTVKMKVMSLFTRRKS